ncbi:branched-chain amino acid ABC transporter permease [Alteribacillus sp. YIM 98480]|uniref:branched-chain amino acid ABC transporter permease n=1 Tax=Alteribacillus sp. YIM 98480 TaxID=2606599 RepID=UPI00131E8670|nr:branched-chain amino acid ABC transporter permease [Alteribacillus sp. YIM 98480]
MKSQKLKYIFNSVVLLFIIVYPFLMNMSGYWMTLLVMMTIYGITAVALNIMIGYGGQISIGHAGFLMIGSYSVAIIADRFELPFVITLLLAGIITAFVGLIISFSAVRLKGHFLAVVTLGFGISVPVIALNWTSLTNGYSGMLVTRPAILSELSLYYFIVGCTVLFLWFMYNILHSSFGRAFISIRESEIAAQSSGINTTFYKTLMFVISSFFTGMAGGLYAYWIGFVGPTDFPVTISFLLLAMIVVGGMHSFYGPIFGAVLFSIIPHFTDEFMGITNIVIGLILVIIILFRPEGLVTIVDWFKMNKTMEKADTISKERGS